MNHHLEKEYSMFSSAEVCMALPGTAKDVFVGTLSFRHVRGQEFQEFEYSKEWLARGFGIDPYMPMVPGKIRARAGHFGCFSDCAPDRWGRSLLRYALLREQGKTATRLYESEYLLRVSDYFRMGALRFLINGVPVASRDHGVPAVKDIRTFHHVIQQFQKGETLTDREFRDVFAPGSSLGGARPKMSVADSDGSLWLAKFPSLRDAYDVPAREAISLEIARLCHLHTPAFSCLAISENAHVLLIKRFDRKASCRIPFLSAMTLLGATDGTSSEYGYLDIAEGMQRIGKENIRQDLQELWRRMVVNICLGNRDDHLRNHGFLWNGKSWRLSPVYDLQIAPDKAAHALAIDDSGDTSPRLDHAIAVAAYYGISAKDAKDYATATLETAQQWHAIGKKLGIAEHSLRQMPELEDVEFYSCA